MTEENEPKRPDYSDPEKFKMLKGGAIYGQKEGRIVAHTQPKDGPYQLDTNRAKELVQRRREIGILRQMRALARSKGIEVPEEIEMEQLAELAGDGLEEIFLHMLKTFKDSKNLRGMAETFGKISAGFMDNDRTPVEFDTLPNTVTILIAQLVTTFQKREAVDEKILENSEGG